MYCDSALFYESTNSFDAFGNVRMVQGDTLTLTSDVLYYNGMDRLARARYNVVLKHLKTILYTDSLDYDRIYDLGYFFEGGRLLDQGNELTSDWGQYQPATHQAVFNYNVRLVNPEPPEPPKTVLVSDTLYYNTNTAIAYVVGPSNIENGESHIYTERGYYHTKTDESFMLDRSILVNEGKHLVGDSVVWNGETKIGEAFGNFVYTDDENKNMLTGNYCYYVDSIGYCETYDSAMVIDFSQKDTLFAHADTFKVFTYYIDTDSMYRILHAYRRVRAFREDMQAVCDSMVYNSKDSCLVMYYDPILWQNGQQMLGEEIRSFFNDSTLDSVQVLRQALSVEKIDSIHYNQVAGHEMHFYFRNGEVYLSTTQGNVYFNYYPFNEDSVMVEMNHTETTLLKLFSDSGKIDYVWMPAATGTMYPVPLIPPDELYLSNFAWFDYIRPVDKMDVFNWRGKKAGSELKKSVQRVAPKQKLSDIKQE
jgi:lipopolysaccharide export system protein LptA